MKLSTRNALAIAAQVLVAALTAYAISIFFTSGGEGNMQVAGWRAFRYFTIDSNVLAALAGLVCIPYEIRALKTGEETLPHWALILYYVGAVAVSVTMMVTVAFLGPIYGYPAMFVGVNFFLHGLNPILCILTVMFLLRGPIRLREAWLCVIPVVVYGAVYFVQVVVIGYENGGWPDFYAFNVNGMWYLALIIIGLLAFLLGVIERLPHRTR